MNLRCKDCGYEDTPDKFYPLYEGSSSDLDDAKCPECGSEEIEEE